LSSYDEKFSAEMARRHHESDNFSGCVETTSLPVNFKYDFGLIVA
jgi:hypothetical protein